MSYGVREKSRKLRTGLTPLQERVMEHMRLGGSFNTTQVADGMDISEHSARRELDALSDLGMVRRHQRGGRVFFEMGVTNDE